MSIVNRLTPSTRKASATGIVYPVAMQGTELDQFEKFAGIKNSPSNNYTGQIMLNAAAAFNMLPADVQEQAYAALATSGYVVPAICKEAK